MCVEKRCPFGEKSRSPICLFSSPSWYEKQARDRSSGPVLKICSSDLQMKSYVIVGIIVIVCKGTTSLFTQTFPELHRHIWRCPAQAFVRCCSDRQRTRNHCLGELWVSMSPFLRHYNMGLLIQELRLCYRCHVTHNNLCLIAAKHFFGPKPLDS